MSDITIRLHTLFLAFGILACSEGGEPVILPDATAAVDGGTPSVVVENGGTITATESWELRGFAVGVAANNHEAEDGGFIMPDVLKLKDGTYRMYYTQRAPLPTGENIHVAESTDGKNWTPKGIALAGGKEDSDRTRIIGGASVIVLPDGRYRMFTRCSVKTPEHTRPDYHMRSAISSDGLTFTDEGVAIENSTWDASSQWLTVGHGRFYPLDDGRWAAIISVQSGGEGPADLALFLSTDAKTWTYERTLYRGFHDPTVIRQDGAFLMVASYLTEYGAMMSSADGLTWPEELTKLEFFEQGKDTALGNETESGDFGMMTLPDGELVILSNFPRNSSIAAFQKQ
jgi:hypothetical protein